MARLNDTDAITKTPIRDGESTMARTFRNAKGGHQTTELLGEDVPCRREEPMIMAPIFAISVAKKK